MTEFTLKNGSQTCVTHFILNAYEGITQIGRSVICPIIDGSIGYPEVRTDLLLAATINFSKTDHVTILRKK